VLAHPDGHFSSRSPNVSALTVVVRMSSGHLSPSRNVIAFPDTIANPSNACVCARQS